MFSSSIRIIYLYLVAFVFLMITIIAVIFTVNQVATLIIEKPSYCISGCNNYHNTEIKALLTSSFTTVISMGIFIFHWRQIEKERLQDDVPEKGNKR